MDLSVPHAVTRSNENERFTQSVITSYSIHYTKLYDDLDILVPVDQPILERVADPPNPVSRKIAKTASALIPNGSTIELGLGRVPGYGRIPQVVMEFLHDRKDIGFHTEMISDTIIPLIEAGAVTGAMKSIDRGKITASFCMGTKRLYDYIHDNPLFSRNNFV